MCYICCAPTIHQKKILTPLSFGLWFLFFCLLQFSFSAFVAIYIEFFIFRLIKWHSNYLLQSWMKYLTSLNFHIFCRAKNIAIHNYRTFLVKKFQAHFQHICSIWQNDIAINNIVVNNRNPFASLLLLKQCIHILHTVEERIKKKHRESVNCS